MRIFVSVSKDEQDVRIHVPVTVVESTVAEHPEAEPFVRTGTTIGVSLPMAGLDVRLLDRLLRQGWEAAAPKRLVAQHSETATAARIPREAMAAGGLAFRAR